jgi:hypothetical protein
LLAAAHKADLGFSHGDDRYFFAAVRAAWSPWMLTRRDVEPKLVDRGDEFVDARGGSLLVDAMADNHIVTSDPAPVQKNLPALVCGASFDRNAASG